MVNMHRLVKKNIHEYDNIQQVELFAYTIIIFAIFAPIAFLYYVIRGGDLYYCLLVVCVIPVYGLFNHITYIGMKIFKHN